MRRGRIAALLALAVAGTAFAQTNDVIPTAVERDRRVEELANVTRDIELSQERQAALRREIDALEDDRAKLNDTLIETSTKARTLEARIDRSEWRLQSLVASEISLRENLDSRRAAFAEVLGALQRMGRNPPPAIVVQAEDALASVRSAMLLTAVVPNLKGEAERLAADLGALVTLRETIATERETLRNDAGQLVIAEARISLLIDRKKQETETTRQALAQSEKRATELADQATSLKELIAKMEVEIEAVAKAAEKARQAEVASLAPNAGSPPQSFGNSDRIAPAISFAKAKAMLPFPANGVVVRRFGEDDGIGGTSQGLSVATRSGARVSTPADGWVVFAGPFRSYGKLLIINASGGYHIVLAGMERIDVELGQFVLAGEPVAVMGEQRLASAGVIDIGASQPMLYIEFRKDGESVDPGPWWARSSLEKVDG